MKKLALAVALLGLLVAGQGAQALIGTVDDVPAATLLLPYFEVQLHSNGGMTITSWENVVTLTNDGTLLIDGKKLVTTTLSAGYLTNPPETWTPLAPNFSTLTPAPALQRHFDRGFIAVAGARSH